MPVSVDVEGGELVVRVTGWDVVWAISRGVRVPLAKVSGVAVVPRGELPHRRGLWRAGSFVPRVLQAGRFAGRGWSEYWVTRWPERVLVVTCAPRSTYDRIVLDVPDPEAAAERIRAAL